MTRPSARVRRLAALALGLSLCACSSAGPEGGRCEAGERSLHILEPGDGEAFTSMDDVDPSMGGVQIDLVVASCGFERDEQIAVYLLDPVETPYAYVAAGDGRAATLVPLIPGALRLEARSLDGAVRSAVISIDVTLD